MPAGSRRVVIPINYAARRSTVCQCAAYNSQLVRGNGCVDWSLTVLHRRRPGLRRRLDSDRDNGQISIHENIQFHSSYQSQRESHTDTGQVTDSVWRGSVSYDIALTNAVQLSSVGKSSFDQLSSKATPLLSDDDTFPDLFPEYPPTLSSTHARSSPSTQAREQG